MNENHPIHINTVSKGIEQDTDIELTGSTQANGLYLDAHNARPNSVDGNSGSNEKIQGEEILYTNDKGLSDYKCIGSASVNSYLVEFWAPRLGSGAGICVINGEVCLKSTLFDLKPDYPLQLDKNESPLNEEVFITDNRAVPYIFNVKDMWDSKQAGSQKYFTAFDPLFFQVNVQSPLDRPVFVELINVGGGGGLPNGQYSYQIRYATTEGDRTAWSVHTPLIPVMESLSSDSRCYPWVKTFGGQPNPTSKTSFAPKIRFRVTNIYNYDFIEVKRTPYNKGAGLDFVPLGTIVARIAIDKQQISYVDYIDPADSNVDIALTEADESFQLAEVETAQTIKYFDRRTILGNVKLASKESSLEFTKNENNKRAWPVIDKMYKAGHKDPWNHVYRKAYMGGEKYGFGVVGFDGVGTQGFVEKYTDFEDYQYPNRRDGVASETDVHSRDGLVLAASTTLHKVNKTHEVFDLSDPTYKTNACDFKNIIRSGKITGLTGSRTTSSVKEDCDEDNGEIENHGTKVSGGLVTCSYQPFHPVRQTDPNVTGHEYTVNTKAYTSADESTCASDSGHSKDYRPNGFSPDYYAHGMMFNGIKNFPKWMKAFSIVRTPAAKRVVCQGLGFYALTKAKYKTVGSASLAGKEQNKFWFYSPDIEQGIVSSDTLNDIIDNPQNYKIQMVSPLGFYSEIYGFEDNALACNRDRMIDMITYVRMIRDNQDPSNINPGEDTSMGTQSGGFCYPDYDKYRNVTQNPNVFGGDPNGGNKKFSLAAVRRKAEGRGQFIELELTENVYGKASTGGSSNRHFNDAGLKDFTEPMYIINIIRDGAEIRDLQAQGYKPTDHYQKIESIIGRHNGDSYQKFLLVDERWEDCIPTPLYGQYGYLADRYIYVKKPNGSYEKWLNVTYKPAYFVSSVETAIINFGVYGSDIKGVYKHNNIGGVNRFFEIYFYHPAIKPEAEDLIIVKYDDRAPIRVYGGDTFVGETIFAPIDAQADAKSDAAETQFAFGIGFPYFKYKLNPRYYTVRKAGAALNAVQDAVNAKLGYIRQMCAMFCVESRCGVHLAYNSEYPNQFFPLINYVIRPNRWDDDKNIMDNGVFQDYQDDYGSQEETQWKWGGFRFLQQINPDYSCELPIRYFSKPTIGFVERTKYYTRIMWSLPRAINVQNSPGLRTFPVNNAFDIDDNRGEIKFLYDDTTGQGENLYAITDRGICMLLTKKSILSDLNSGEIAYMAADGFIRAQYWINKEVGMPEDFWRTAVSNYVPAAGDQGDESRIKALFFANRDSVFRMIGNVVTDIGRQGYYKKIRTPLKNVFPTRGSFLTAAYNKLYHEYWIYFEYENKCFVWGQKDNRWYGTNGFSFDKFTSRGNTLFGHRNLETYELNKGYVMNNEYVKFVLTGATSPEQKFGKEFIEIRINSSEMPTNVEFRKELDGPKLCQLTPAKQGSLYMKDYNGFRGHIPRMDAAVDPDRKRLQHRVLVWTIEYQRPFPFKVVDVVTQYKVLKLK